VEVDPAACVGVDVINLGVHDRVVPEAIWRLLDPDELAYDIGANIGQNASIMALRLGPQGRVVAFEPGPEAYRLLTRNVANWERYRLSPITIVPKGLSSKAGVGMLHETFELGGFSLEDQQNRPMGNASKGASHEIELTTLDAYAASAGRIGLIKIDVEGHELAVLQGASKLLHERRARDIIFEDYEPQPSPVARLLQAAGYEVTCLEPAWSKPVLMSLEDRAKLPAAEPYFSNFVATLDPERALARFRPGGWRCLSARAWLKE